ncbi:MAG TPA: hypothetical protein VK017_07585 [Sphingobacterium sp.]|nr:hypothetical protein [Sphingobacterium sp.]
MKKIPMDASVYLFEIDDVLYPKKDYILQVFYLFSNFVEYTEGKSVAKDLLAFLKEAYEHDDEEIALRRAMELFGLETKYEENYERLRANAHLPLKLFLKEDIKALLLELFGQNKHVAILTDGNPVEQLNKLKHLDWQELSPYLTKVKIYFFRELEFRNIDPFDYIMQEYHVNRDQIYQIS